MNETMELVHLGGTLRQMRRQQSLTQTELGGDHFSKSYISAVERSKIVPSYEALHYFAEKLGLVQDFFEKFLPQFEYQRTLKPVSDTNRDPQTEVHQAEMQSEQLLQEKILYLLDVLLESGEEAHPAFKDFLPLVPDVAAALSPDFQGRYTFLLGLITQRREDFSTALLLLEQALGLAPSKYRPAILDALGTNYYYVHSYYVAVEYHERALALLYRDILREKEEVSIPDSLLMKVEFHCGNDYHAIGAHRSARKHFEQARSLLRSAHNMQTAAQLYLKLGYSIYADVYQRTALLHATEEAIEETEREFQRSISFFVQSRALYQVSSDRNGETQARLSQVMVLLDLSKRRWQVAQLHRSSVNCAVLLDEAEEQCRQILLNWEHEQRSITTAIETLLYTAIAYLIRVYLQRATIAYTHEYTGTAERERTTASCLCQFALDTFEKPDFQFALLHKVLVSKNGTRSNALSLPRVPEAFFQLNSDSEQRSPVSCSIILFAAGEVSEILGKTSIDKDYVNTCYERADKFFEDALSTLQAHLSYRVTDKSYLYRSYYRCIDVLQERQRPTDLPYEKVTKDLLNFLKHALQSSYFSSL